MVTKKTKTVLKKDDAPKKEPAVKKPRKKAEPVVKEAAEKKKPAAGQVEPVDAAKVKLKAEKKVRAPRKKAAKEVSQEKETVVVHKIEEKKEHKVPDTAHKTTVKKEKTEEKHHVVKPQDVEHTAQEKKPVEPKVEHQKSKPQAIKEEKPAHPVVEKPKEEPKQEVQAVPPLSAPEEKVAEKILVEIKVNELTNVRDLSEKMKVSSSDLIKKLLSMGTLVTINQRLEASVLELLAGEFGYKTKFVSIYEDKALEEETEDVSKLVPRSPVVTIMGHVDHGKTSLLDAIRKSDVAGGEAGGITQHIGAYKVKTPKGEISFLDTPGHEAFTAMRSRGAQCTDIVVLVVAADDGIMPQTVEAIDHARAAGVPIIIAINKTDIQGANPAQVKQELAKYNLVPEDWGGDTICVEVSAKKGTNIDTLLEMILLKSEMMELKANPDSPARGVIIEAKLDHKRGPVITVLIKKGTLRIGDNFIVGTTFGKVRAMTDDHGARLEIAKPVTPVEILGVNELPQAGDQFIGIADERQARDIATNRKSRAREESLRPVKHLSLEDISSGKVKEIRVVVKADVGGSLEAVRDSLEKLSTSEITLRIIHGGIGTINESDITLAAASDALIIGFNIRPDSNIERMAEKEGVNIRIYRIIYEAIDEVKAAMEGLLDPEYKEVVTGKVSVKQVFKITKAGMVAGCTVLEGKVQRSNKIRVLRDSVIVHEGSISSLKRFKDDVKEVEKGFECGVVLEKYPDLKPGDILESYTQEKVARKL